MTSKFGNSIDDATPEEWDAITTAFTVHPSDLVIEEPVKEKQFDAVARPDHYNTGSIEAIEAIKASKTVRCRRTTGSLQHWLNRGHRSNQSIYAPARVQGLSQR